MKNIRTCISCREKFDKTNHNFLKITISNNEPVINEGELFGRSLYICNCNDCINKVIKNKIINKVLKKQIDSSFYDKLSSLKR